MTHSDYRQYKSGFQPFTIQNSKIFIHCPNKGKGEITNTVRYDSACKFQRFCQMTEVTKYRVHTVVA